MASKGLVFSSLKRCEIARGWNLVSHVAATGEKPKLMLILRGRISDMIVNVVPI